MVRQSTSQINFTIGLGQNSPHRTTGLRGTADQTSLDDPAESIRKIYIVHDGTVPLLQSSGLQNIILIFNKIPALAQRVKMDVVIKALDPPCILGPSAFHRYPHNTPLLFRQFVRLRLRDVHFRLGSHFVKLVSEFRNPRQLEVEDIPWDDISPREVLRPWPYALEDISLRERDRYAHGVTGASSPLLIKAVASFEQPVRIARASAFSPLLRSTERPQSFVPPPKGSSSCISHVHLP